jgi:outer membrane lipoprotein-sorting protein
VRQRAACLAAACFALAAQAGELTIKELFDALAKARPARATFQERKFIGFLDKPLETSGELAFTPPDRLEKRTLKPTPESVVVAGDVVVLERGGKRTTLSLDGNPGLAALADSLRAVLAGDLASLTRTYSVGLDGSSAAWRLKLRPLDSSAASLVERIEIAGAETQVRRVEIFQPDGDRSIMTIAP